MYRKYKYMCILLLALSSTASAESVQYEKNKNVYGDKWSVEVGGFTGNQALPENFNEVNVGYKLGVNYNFNENFYGEVTGRMFDRDHYTFEPLVGAKMNLTKHIQPYIEVEGVFYLNRQNTQRAFNYDFGVKALIYKGSYAYIESTNFFEYNEANYEVGFGVPVTNRLVFELSYNMNIKGHRNGLSANLEYLV